MELSRFLSSQGWVCENEAYESVRDKNMGISKVKFTGSLLLFGLDNRWGVEKAELVDKLRV